MKALLDTHFLIWTLLDARRLVRYPWLPQLRPWGVSPVALLELEILSEAGRLAADVGALVKLLETDPRFVVDDPSLRAVMSRAYSLSWTRDPFDRLLVAHSAFRRVPLVTVDRTIRGNYRLVLPEPGVAEGKRTRGE